MACPCPCLNDPITLLLRTLQGALQALQGQFDAAVLAAKHTSAQETMMRCAAEAVAREAAKEDEDSFEQMQLERRLNKLHRERRLIGLKQLRSVVSRWLEGELRGLFSQWRARCWESLKDVMDRRERSEMHVVSCFTSAIETLLRDGPEFRDSV